MLDTFCLSLVIYLEARGEPVDGQMMVAEVVLNRVDNERYPDTVCDVVYDYKQFTGIHSEIDLGSIFEDDAWHTSVDVAHEALEGETLNTGATHYHTTSVLPYWANDMEKLGQYGEHIFYKETER